MWWQVIKCYLGYHERMGSFCMWCSEELELESFDGFLEELARYTNKARIATTEMIVNAHKEGMKGDHAIDFWHCTHPDCRSMRKYLEEHGVE